MKGLLGVKAWIALPPLGVYNEPGVTQCGSPDLDAVYIFDLRIAD